MNYELFQRFYAIYARVKAGDLPDTFDEWADIVQLCLDLAKAIKGQIPIPTPVSAMSVSEAEAVLAPLAEGSDMEALAPRFPALRELLLEMVKIGIGELFKRM